jgi:putative membrane protein
MVGALKNLTPDERARVSEAVAAAQSRTQARFAFVVVHASDRYHLYPVVWGAALAILSLGAMALGVHYKAFPPIALSFAFTVQAAVFVLASLLLEWLPLRILIVPKHAKHAHARTLAHREFAVRILSHPGHGGGALFFVSLAERYAEVIVDHVLHQAVGQAEWDRIVSEFTAKAARGQMADGVVAAANACGALLEQHHPKA